MRAAARAWLPVALLRVARPRGCATRVPPTVDVALGDLTTPDVDALYDIDEPPPPETQLNTNELAAAAFGAVPSATCVGAAPSAWLDFDGDDDDAPIASDEETRPSTDLRSVSKQWADEADGGVAPDPDDDEDDEDPAVGARAVAADPDDRDNIDDVELGLVGANFSGGAETARPRP